RRRCPVPRLRMGAGVMSNSANPMEAAFLESEAAPHYLMLDAEGNVVNVVIGDPDATPAAGAGFDDPHARPRPRPAHPHARDPGRDARDAEDGSREAVGDRQESRGNRRQSHGP